jgi:hypothetical protein
MILRRAATACCALALACGGLQSARSTESLFDAPGADRAEELAPDLYLRAEAASSRADHAGGRKDGEVAEDYRTQAELWLAAAVTEAERIELSRRLDELRREEERWAKQLARDQEASAVVATDISRYQARAVALREAERVASLSRARTTDDATLDAVLTRVRFNLALAEALGAGEKQLRTLRARADTMSRTRPRSAQAAEALLLDTDALIGEMRAEWPSPRPGASTELVETARLTGFSADRTGTGVVVRSGRLFTPGGQVSNAAVKRLAGLLGAFPHGPVACQVVVPELQSRVWSRRVAALIDRLQRIDDPARVATSMIATDSLSVGAVQCTFAAYREP